MTKGQTKGLRGRRQVIGEQRGDQRTKYNLSYCQLYKFKVPKNIVVKYFGTSYTFQSALIGGCCNTPEEQMWAFDSHYN